MAMDHIVSVRLTSAERESLERRAAAEGCSVSALIRRLVQVEEFYEDDEPVADVVRAFASAEKHLTSPFPPTRTVNPAPRTILWDHGAVGSTLIVSPQVAA